MSKADTPSNPEETIFIGNAGLVLLAPYLSTLFRRLDLLSDTDDGPRLVGMEAMSRGVHLLQYIVDGQCDRPEALLTLNKLLCGLTPAQPIAPSISATQPDRDICDGLLAAIIANWPILSGTSSAGLRETFLQREGSLFREDAHWSLRVQRKALDVLVDQIPWSFALIAPPWADHPIHVVW